MNTLIKIVIIFFIVKYALEHKEQFSFLTTPEPIKVDSTWIHKYNNTPSERVRLSKPIPGMDGYEEQSSNETYDEESYDESSEEVEEESKFKSEHIKIVPLGNVDYSDLSDAVTIIKDFYGYSACVKPKMSITEDMYIQGTDKILDADVCIDKLNANKKTIYIVDKKLWSNGDYLRGYATRGGNTVIVRGEKSFLKETIIHELGHTLGLGHCTDKTCIMATENDAYDSGDFCNKCKSKLNIYE
jgi:predicted Zn-dependent protease